MIMAIDLGSSSFRAAVFTADGQLCSETLVRQSVTATTASDGTMTYDAAALMRCLTRVISRTLRLADRQGYTIRGIGISAMMHSLLGVRRTTAGSPHAGAPTTPVFAWGDTRSETERETLVEYFNRHRLYAQTGCPLHSSYWLLKLAWLRRHLILREWQWMSFPDYVWWQLFGVFGTSLSMASATGIYARPQMDWDETILAYLGLERHNLTPIVPDNWALPGTALQPRFKNRWPQLQSAYFFPALGDGACSNLGSLCLPEHQAAVNIGTTAAVRVTLPKRGEPEEPPPGLWVYHLDRQHVLVGGALSNAGNLLAWGRRTLRLPPPAILETKLQIAQDTGLTVLPFLAGERSPGWHPQATGIICGIRMSTRPADIWQALLEAIALQLAWIVSELEAAHLLPQPTRFIVSGRVASSMTFATMLCHVLGRPTYITSTEVSARGAALWVSRQLGWATNNSLPAGIWLQPNAAIHNHYRKRLEQHRATYQKLVQIWSMP
jgi:gluconokinase